MRAALVAAAGAAGGAGAFKTSYAPRPGRLVAWGRDNYMNCLGPDAKQKGCVPMPAKLTDVVAVAAGKDLAFALRANGVGVLWGLDKVNAHEDLAKAQPLTPAGELVNKDDAFTHIASGRGAWLARKQTGFLATGGGYMRGEAGTPTPIPIPDEMQAILKEEIPAGGSVVAMGGGGGTFCVVLRRHNESAIVDEMQRSGALGDHADNSKGGRVYSWNDKEQGGWTSEQQWNGIIKHGPNAGFFQLSGYNKQGCSAQRYDRTTEAWGWNNHNQANSPNGTVQDIQSGGYKLAWINDDGSIGCNCGDNQGQAGWHVEPWDPPGTVAQKPAPGKKFAALSIGYAFHSILQTDGSIRIISDQGRDTCAGMETCTKDARAMELRTDVLAVTQANGVGIAIVGGESGSVPCLSTFPPAGTVPYFPIPCPASGCAAPTTAPCPAPPPPPAPTCPPATQGVAYSDVAHHKAAADTPAECCATCLSGYVLSGCSSWDFDPSLQKQMCRLFAAPTKGTKACSGCVAGVTGAQPPAPPAPGPAPPAPPPATCSDSVVAGKKYDAKAARKAAAAAPADCCAACAGGGGKKPCVAWDFDPSLKFPCHEYTADPGDATVACDECASAKHA